MRLVLSRRDCMPANSTPPYAGGRVERGKRHGIETGGGSAMRKRGAFMVKGGAKTPYGEAGGQASADEGARPPYSSGPVPHIS